MVSVAVLRSVNLIVFYFSSLIFLKLIAVDNKRAVLVLNLINVYLRGYIAVTEILN